MFSMKIIDSDVFLEMPLSTQALYFHLNMRADDDGFLNNAKKIVDMIKATKNDYDLLVAKRFIIQFPDGICVIKHWRINNYLRKDRYHESLYEEEKGMLTIKKNGAYSLNTGVEPLGIPVVNQLVTKSSIDKNREEENRIDTVSKDTVCRTDVQRIVNAWNELSVYGIKQISKLTAGTKRHDSLIARIKQYGVEDILKAIEKVKDSDFLQGKSSSWIIKFDWFVLPNNFPKVLEGNYDNKPNTNNEHSERISEVDKWV